jgi:hypothetical protein
MNKLAYFSHHLLTPYPICILVDPRHDQQVGQVCTLPPSLRHYLQQIRHRNHQTRHLLNLVRNLPRFPLLNPFHSQRVYLPTNLLAIHLLNQLPNHRVFLLTSRQVNHQHNRLLNHLRSHQLSQVVCRQQCRLHNLVRCLRRNHLRSQLLYHLTSLARSHPAYRQANQPFNPRLPHPSPRPSHRRHYCKAWCLSSPANTIILI